MAVTDLQISVISSWDGQAFIQGCYYLMISSSPLLGFGNILRWMETWYFPLAMRNPEAVH